MKRLRSGEEQVIAILEQHEGGISTADVCREHGVSPATLCEWKAKFGGFELSDARKPKALEGDNANRLSPRDSSLGAISTSCRRNQTMDYPDNWREVGSQVGTRGRKDFEQDARSRGRGLLEISRSLFVDPFPEW